MRHLLAKWGVVVLTLAIWGHGQALKAQDIEVRQIRGQQAIVEIPPGLNLQRGQKLILKPEMGYGDGSEDWGMNEKAAGVSRSSGSRRFLMGGGFKFSSLKGKENSEDYKRTLTMVDARFGLNLGVLELGGFTESHFAVSRYGGSDGKYAGNSMNPGAFIEINLIRNEEPNNFIPGFGLDLAMIRQRQYMSGTSSDQDTTLSGLSLFPHTYVKWFWPGTTGAMKVNLGYRFKKVSGSWKQEGQPNFDIKEEESSIELGGAIAIYF